MMKLVVLALLALGSVSAHRLCNHKAIEKMLKLEQLENPLPAFAADSFWFKTVSKSYFGEPTTVTGDMYVLPDNVTYRATDTITYGQCVKKEIHLLQEKSPYIHDLLSVTEDDDEIAFAQIRLYVSGCGNNQFIIYKCHEASDAENQIRIHPSKEFLGVTGLKTDNSFNTLQTCKDIINDAFKNKYEFVDQKYPF